MEISPKLWILLGIFATSLAVGVWLISRMPETPNDPVTPADKKLRPAPQVQKPTQRTPSMPPQKESILNNHSSDVVKAAEAVLALPMSQERTTQWQALVEQGAYEDLVRLAEIVSKPQLDDDRAHLRYLAVVQLGKLGLLERFTQERQAFDNQYYGSSKTLQLAVMEWARQDGITCLLALQNRMAPLFKKNAEKELIPAAAKGLLLGSSENLQPTIDALNPAFSEKIVSAMESVSPEQLNLPLPGWQAKAGP